MGHIDLYRIRKITFFLGSLNSEGPRCITSFQRLSNLKFLPFFTGTPISVCFLGSVWGARGVEQKKIKTLSFRRYIEPATKESHTCSSVGQETDEWVTKYQWQPSVFPRTGERQVRGKTFQSFGSLMKLLVRDSDHHRILSQLYDL